MCRPFTLGILIVLVVFAALDSACIVDTSAGRFDCSFTPQTGVVCTRIDAAYRP